MKKKTFHNIFIKKNEDWFKMEVLRLTYSAVAVRRETLVYYKAQKMEN